MGRTFGKALCAALAGSLAVAMASTSTLAHAEPAQPGGVAVGRIDQVSVRTAPVLHTISPDSVAAGSASVTSWTRQVKDGTSTFPSTMVGKNPTVKQASPATTVPTKLIPVVIRLANGDTYDPTVGDSCDGTSALTRVTNSPIVKTRAWTFGATSVGTGQYIDAFQRANFATSTRPGGINPGYHVSLGVTVLPKITINVPGADSAEGSISCGNGHFGGVEINWLDGFLRQTVLPSLAAKGVTDSTFPMFLTDNVIEYVNTTNNCCVLGFHSALHNNAGIQTYGISMYDNTGVFGPTSGSKTDIATLSHEVGEWMDDPFVNNPTKPWGHIGQVSGCQNNLEVGDPLSGHTTPVTMNGMTYHVQDLAFASWFFHQKPSSGVNGWYSNFGTFRTAAAACQ